MTCASTKEVNFTDLPGTYPDAWHDCLADIDWHTILQCLDIGDEHKAMRLLSSYLEKARATIQEEINHEFED